MVEGEVEHDGASPLVGPELALIGSWPLMWLNTLFEEKCCSWFNED